MHSFLYGAPGEQGDVVHGCLGIQLPDTHAGAFCTAHNLSNWLTDQAPESDCWDSHLSCTTVERETANQDAEPLSCRVKLVSSQRLAAWGLGLVMLINGNSIVPGPKWAFNNWWRWWEQIHHRKHLLCARLHSKHFAFITSFTFYIHPMNR